MGDNFPEGTSQSDPSSVPPLDPDSLEDRPPRVRDEDEAIGVPETVSEDEPTTEEEPENQQAG
jgi:hypothetical protein